MDRQEQLNKNVVPCADFDISVYKDYLGIRIVSTAQDEGEERRKLEYFHLILNRDEAAGLIAALSKTLAEV